MDTILQDLSASSVAQALDANKIAFGTLLSTLPGAALSVEPGLRWFETGVPNSLFNGVVQTRLESGELARAIERVLVRFRQRNLPFHWHIGPSSQSSALNNLLEAHGILHDEDEPGMWIDLWALNEQLPLSARLVIQSVDTDEQLRQWTRTWGCGAPEEVIQHWYTVYAGLPYGSRQGLRLYLGLMDGEPVATVELFLAAGVAAINHVVTVHRYRRQGIGALMTLMAAREARETGYRVGVLTASPMGINIYRRLGFQECCQVSTYEWNPASGEEEPDHSSGGSV